MGIFDFWFKLLNLFKRDKRREPRARIFEDLYVDFQSTRSTPPIRGTGEGRDISLTGVQFFSDKKFHAETPLDLVLRFPPGVLAIDRIAIHARVVRCHKGFRERQCRIACAFEKIDPESRKQLAALLSWLKEREKKYLFFRYQAKSN